MSDRAVADLPSSQPAHTGRAPSLGRARWLLPSLADSLFLAVFILAVAYGSHLLNADPDLGWHLTLGRWVLDEGRVPTIDRWSHTVTGEPMETHSWMADVLFALAERTTGLTGVVLLTALLIAAAFWLQARWLLGRGFNAYLVLGFGGWAAFTSGVQWLARPLVFTYVLAALFAWTLDTWRLSAEASAGARPTLRRVWVLPLLTILWANLHGAVSISWVLLATHLAGALWAWMAGGGASAARLARDLALAFGLCMAATLINPVGAGLLENTRVLFSGSYFVELIQEYASPNFHSVEAWPFLVLVLLAILVGGLQRGGPRRNPAPVLMLLTWTVFALYTARNIPLFAIVAVPALVELADERLIAFAASGEHWAEALKASAQRLLAVERALVGGIPALLIAGLVAMLLVAQERLDPAQGRYRFESGVFPVAAADYLAAHPPAGRMFNDYFWGGYLLYRLWPTQNVFIDSRATVVYPDSLLKDYVQVAELAPGWQEILTRWRVDWVIFPAGEALSRQLAEEPGWRQVYADETAVVYVRRTAESPD